MTRDAAHNATQGATVSSHNRFWERLADLNPVDLTAPPGGVWDALREALNPALFRPARAPEATATPLVTRRGERYYSLANRVRSTYLRLTPEDYYLWTLMDGTRSVKELIIEYFTKFGSLAFDQVAELVVHLRLDHMLTDPVVNIYASVQRQLARRRSRTLPRLIWQVITGQRSFRVHHIDGLVTALHRRGGAFLYSPPMQVVYVGACAIGGWFFLQHVISGRYPLFQMGGSYGKGVLLLLLLNYVGITVHESAHALTCKHYGAHVNGAGVMLYYGLPAYFVDTTDVWTKPAAARIATSWAGPYSGVILAGFGAMVVQAIPGSPLAPILHRLSFVWILVLLYNVIPLLELDGYFMLVDWLEIPMLRARALAFFRRDLWGRLRRHERLVGQERLLAWFGGLSLVFSILVVASALVSWEYWLKTATQALWGGDLGSKALLVVLLLVLTLPLVMGLGSRAASATKAAARWTREQWHLPHGHALRQREELLRGVHFLSPLSPDELTQVAMRMRPHAFHAGETVFQHGAASDRFYIIERGVAEAWLGDEPRPRAQLTRGDYFGETSLLQRVNYLGTVRAGSLLRVFWLGRSDFDHFLAPHVAAHLDDQILTLDALRRFPALAGLSSRELDALAARFHREQFAPGAVVFEERDTGETFYIVESGQAEVVVGGHRTGIVGHGACLGELALFHGLPRQATVRALTPLVLYTLSRPDFDALVATTLHHGAACVLEAEPASAGRAGAA